MADPSADLAGRRKAVARLLVEGVGEERRSALRRNMTADARWFISGSLPISGEHRVEDLFAITRRLFVDLAEPVTFDLLSLVGEGDALWLEAEGHGVFSDGRKYAHRVAMLLVFDGERIARIREYADTDHLRLLFGVSF